jgi:hypothetical protein
MPKSLRCGAWRSTPTEPIPLQFVKRLADETSRPGNGHHRQHRISFPVSTAAGRSTTDVLEQHKK